eukprot:403370882
MNTYSTQQSFFSDDRAHKYQQSLNNYNNSMQMQMTIKQPINILEVNHDIFDKFGVATMTDIYTHDICEGSEDQISLESSLQYKEGLRLKKERRYKRLRYSKNLSKRTSHLNSQDKTPKYLNIDYDSEELHQSNNSSQVNLNDSDQNNQQYYDQQQQRLNNYGLQIGSQNNYKKSLQNQSIKGNNNKNLMRLNQSVLEIQEPPEPLHLDDLRTPEQQFNYQRNVKIQQLLQDSQDDYDNNRSILSQIELQQIDNDIKKQLFEEQQNYDQNSHQKSQKRLQSAKRKQNDNQQSDAIKSLKELQLKKKQQQLQSQESLINLIREQKLLEQLKEEALIQQYARAHKDLEIIEEQITLSSKDNTQRDSKSKQKIKMKQQSQIRLESANKNSIPKKKLQTSLQKAKNTNIVDSLNNSQQDQSTSKVTVSQTVSNFMMRRSNSQSMFNQQKKKSQTTNQSFKINNKSLLQINGLSSSNLNSHNTSMADQSIYKLDQSLIQNQNQEPNNQSMLRASNSQSRFKLNLDNLHGFYQNVNLQNMNNSETNLIQSQGLNSQGFSLTRPQSKKKLKKSSSKTNMDDSPYNSNYHLRILHDYFDIDCQQIGLNKDGMPQIKIRKINRQGSQGRLNYQDSHQQQNQQQTLLSDVKNNQSVTSLQRNLLSRDASVNSFNSASQKDYHNQSSINNIPTLNLDSINIIPPQVQSKSKIGKQKNTSQNPNFQKFQKEIEQKYFGQKISYQTANNIINTNHNSYMCFGVNIIQNANKE